jgi:aryl-alcohol dehydrogenase-like predicted oxidoreductase
MGDGNTTIADRAASIVADLGYAVSQDGGERRAECTWRTVRVTQMAEPRRPPPSGSDRCFVTHAAHVDELEARLGRHAPDSEWAIIGVRNEPADEVVHDGARATAEGARCRRPTGPPSPRARPGDRSPASLDLDHRTGVGVGTRDPRDGTLLPAGRRSRDMVHARASGTFDIGGEETVNRLGYGALRLTGEDMIGPPADEAAAKDVLRRAVELGVDFVDTADSYGPGTSERLIREAGVADDVFLATKAGLLRNDDGDWLAHGDPEYIHNEVFVSRDRLGVDTIDLYQYHRPDPDTPFEDAVQAFAELKDEGFVSHVGLSNVDVEQLEAARDMVEIATVQNQYNVARRGDESVLEACEDDDIGFIPWFPLAAGDLGEFGDVIDDVAAAHEATRYQIALAWLLEHSPVTLPIPGTSGVDHLEENVAAADIDLTDDEYARLTDA